MEISPDTDTLPLKSVELNLRDHHTPTQNFYEQGITDKFSCRMEEMVVTSNYKGFLVITALLKGVHVCSVYHLHCSSTLSLWRNLQRMTSQLIPGPDTIVSVQQGAGWYKDAHFVHWPEPASKRLGIW